MNVEFLVLFFQAVMLTFLLGSVMIPLARKYKARQSIREEGPKSHRIKSGTPTMGGIFFLLALLAMVAFYKMFDASVLWILFLTIGYGVLGFSDDFIKANKKRNLGLTAKQKLGGQFLLSVVFCWGLVETLGFSTSVVLPFFDISFDLGWLFYPFVVTVVVGASNAVNLTDGLDGLAAGCCVIAFGAYTLYCHLEGLSAIGNLSLILSGCCAGFLFYNYHPAKIFMGDTGSLALGGAIAAIAVMTKTEILLVFLGGVFVAEALSVILQVISFKLTGKRIFKMSPLHHHFELSGWSEVRVVWTFWLVEGFCATLAVIYALY